MKHALNQIKSMTVLTLIGLTLTSCSNASKSATKFSSRPSSRSKMTSAHQTTLPHRTKKKVVMSSHTDKSRASSSQAQSASANSQQSANAKVATSSSSTVSSSPSQQKSSNQLAYGQLPPASGLSDFVNRYGVSPALYLIEHYGMGELRALQSLPNGMKTFGEKQTQYWLEKDQH